MSDETAAQMDAATDQQVEAIRRHVEAMPNADAALESVQWMLEQFGKSDRPCDRLLCMLGSLGVAVVMGACQRAKEADHDPTA